MKILFIGDTYGLYGLDYLLEQLPELKRTYKPNMIIVNGENLAEGRGITEQIYKELMKVNVSAITMGNWTWGNYNLLDFIESSVIIRPANFKEAPGVGYKNIKFNDKNLLVINLLGRTFMNANVENPFETIDNILEKEKADYIFVDFHAEATSEKIAMAHYLDGRVDALVGTHTHVQTNDDRKYPKGLLYITDVGMTGSMDGVIGVEKEIVLRRFKTGYSTGNVVAKGRRQLNGVFLDLTTKKIEKIRIEE